MTREEVLVGLRAASAYFSKAINACAADGVRPGEHMFSQIAAINLTIAMLETPVAYEVPSKRVSIFLVRKTADSDATPLFALPEESKT